MTLAPNTQLGPYEILTLIGKGGMGEVYCARDSRLGRKVAIKVLLPSFTADVERLSRFEQETKTLALLNHPNILHIYDTGYHGNQPYLIMEFLDGQTLRERMDGRPMSSRKAIEIAQQVAKGLAAAHEKGITHRDLKPENIFISGDDHVKILDFGLAKLRLPDNPDTEVTRHIAPSPSITQTGMVVGTVGYLSPEQVVGRPADPRSDIFSLGVVLWEMLNGSRPFRGDSAVETMHAILKEEPPELGPLSNVPPSIERILRRCLEKDPKARFQSAQDLAFDLEMVPLSSASQATLAQRALGRKRANPWVKRFGAMAAVAVVLTGGAFWGTKVFRKDTAIRFQRLTYQNATVRNARFSPDGRTYVYSVSTNGGPSELWTGRVDGMGTRRLGLPLGCDVLSISASGEMAVLLNAAPDSPGMLARVPLSGGSPREVLERVYAADWSPDGRDLAVVRDGANGRRRLEYPIGNLLYEAPEAVLLEYPRISPDGSLVAFALHSGAMNGELCTVDMRGRRRLLAQGQCDTLQWTPKGDEVLFTKVLKEDSQEVRAVDLSGHQRLVYAPLGRIFIHDISRTGQVLLDHTISRQRILGRFPADASERDLSWLQSSSVADLSWDGRTMLFGELQEGSEPGGAYMRRTDGSEAVRLGDGDPLVLSPDAKWGLVRTLEAEPELMLLPIGAGESKRLPTHGVRAEWGLFMPDGKQLLLGGVEKGKAFGCYLQNIDTGEMVQLSWEVAPDAYAVIAPDGKRAAIGPTNGKVQLVSFHSEPARTLDGFQDGEWLLQWGGDGRFLYVADASGIPAKVYRVNVSNGQRTLWKELMPIGNLGANRMRYISITPDGQAYAYSYTQVLTSDLYLMDGWK